LIDDKELILRCQDNDRFAQKTLFEKYASKMMATCMRYCDNQEDARDLLQDGFYKIFLNINSFKGDSRIDTWMTRVFINLALNKKRLGRYKYDHYELDSQYELAADDVDETPIKDIEPETVLEALNRLPEIYKIVLNMYAIDNLSHQEIATQLGISVGSSKSRLSRGRVLLNTLLQRK
jgi:RNA polymerase sigma-70 factor (ECF subfamily)